MAAHYKAWRRSRLRIFSGRAQTAKLSELDLPATPSSARVESEAPSRTNARVIVWTNKQTNRQTDRRTSIIIRDAMDIGVIHCHTPYVASKYTAAPPEVSTDSITVAETRGMGPVFC